MSVLGSLDLVELVFIAVLVVGTIVYAGTLAHIKRGQNTSKQRPLETTAQQKTKKTLDTLNEASGSPSTGKWVGNIYHPQTEEPKPPIFSEKNESAPAENVVSTGKPKRGWYALGVRQGQKKVLVLSQRDLQSSFYSQSEKGSHLSLYGFVSKRKVFGYEAEAAPSEEWNRVIVLEPLNISEHRIEADDWRGMMIFGQLAGNLRAAVTVLKKALEFRHLQVVYEDRFKEATEKLARETDEKLGLKMEEAQGKVGEEERKPLLRFSTWQWISLVFAFAAGYIYGLPYLRQYYPAINDLQAGVLVAALAFLANLLYRRWRPLAE